MNTHAEYRRHSYRPADPPEPAEAAASELAHHRDPSVAATRPIARDSKGIAWVRPTELASYAGPMVGRGIDLQAELVRRARRTPARASRAIRAGGPDIASPPPSSSRQQEGLQL